MITQSQTVTAVSNIREFQKHFVHEPMRNACDQLAQGLTAILNIVTDAPPFFLQERSEAFWGNDIFAADFTLDKGAKEVLEALIDVECIFFELGLIAGKPPLFSQAITSFLNKNRSQLDDDLMEFRDFHKARIIASVQKSLTTAAQVKLETTIEAYDKKTTPLAGKVEAWEENLSTWEKRFSDLDTQIKQNYGRLSLASLTKGFYRMRAEKNLEKWVQVAMMVIIGSALVSVPIVVAWNPWGMPVIEWSLASLPRLLPIVATELLLLYFFRIALRNFYSVKAQLLQLDLRVHLCGFIHGYSEFAKKTRIDKDDKILEKFESVVFSGITADISNIPSQFDGLDSLLSMIKELRTGASKSPP